MIALILGLLITVITGFISFRSKYRERRIANQSIVNEILLFALLVIGAFSSFTGGCFSAKNAEHDRLELKKKDSLYTDLLLKNNKKADDLKDSIISAKNQIIDLKSFNSAESNRLRDSVSHAKSQIIENQGRNYYELYMQTTGGDIIPCFQAASYEKNAIHLVMTNPGKYAVQDLVITFLDTYKLKMEAVDINNVNLAALGFNYTVTEKVGTVSPNDAISLIRKYIPDDWNDFYYTFYVSYKTGGYHWSIKWKRNPAGEFRVVESKYIDAKIYKEIKFDKTGGHIVQ